MKGSEKLSKILEYLSLTPAEFADEIGLKTKQVIYDIQNDKVDFSKNTIIKINEHIPEISAEWLLTGKGEMLRKADTNTNKEGRLIPLYDNVSTVGGNLSRATDVDTSYSKPTEYIDTGDWFREATAAIRHYEDSMDEYPTGCILALKEIRDRTLIIPGKDYVIETDEYRVTKRIQFGEDNDHFTAYSTNQETYADGRLIHEPFPIPKQSIRRILLVLGYVVKKNGGTMVYNK